MCYVTSCAANAPADTAAFIHRVAPLSSLAWPEGTELIPFEDLEGAILISATMTSRAGADTSGSFVLDTGSGYLAVDLALSRILGLADSSARPASVDLAPRPLPRLRLGGLQMDQVFPVLTVDAGVVRRVTGRPVLGLVGQSLLHDRVVVFDYPSGELALLPPETSPGPAPNALGLALSPGAVAIPFRLVGDGKAIVLARVGGEGGIGATELRLIVDTGATKSVLFESALARRLPGWRSWPRISGIGAPTLMGDAKASIVRVPATELGIPERGVVLRGMDAVVLGGGLRESLERGLGEPVDGLLGYSFLKHYRVAVDYPRRLLWLDPSRGDVPDRPEEYCHPGVQLEDSRGTIRITAVAGGSPAARAGVRTGDELLSVDGRAVAGTDVVAVSRRLEGAPGSAVVLGLRRGSREWSEKVIRTCLL